MSPESLRRPFEMAVPPHSGRAGARSAHAARGNAGGADLWRHHAGRDDGDAGGSGGFRIGFSLNEGIVENTCRPDRTDRGARGRGRLSTCRSASAEARSAKAGEDAAAPWPGRSAAGCAGSKHRGSGQAARCRRCRRFYAAGRRDRQGDGRTDQGSGDERRDRRGACRRFLDAGKGHRLRARGCRPAQCARQADRRLARAGIDGSRAALCS
jgi:hypothetical protein